MKRTVPVAEKTMLALGMDETRGIARELVRKSEYECGSRMLAYDNVGRKIGMSGMWVRKLVRGYGDVRLLHVTAMKIQEAYRHICERVEQNAANERARDAAIAGTMGLVALVPQTQAHGNDGEAA